MVHQKGAIWVHCKIPQSTHGRVVDWEGRPCKWSALGPKDDTGEIVTEDRQSKSEGSLPETQPIVTTGFPGRARETFLMMQEGGEFFYNLERSSLLNQMFSTTESQSIGNDGPGSDDSSSSPENINVSRRNACLHIWVAVCEQSSGNHTHDFLVEKIFKSEKQSLIFKVRLFIKHERMNQAKWRTPVSAAPQE